MNKNYKILTGQICPYCNCETELVKAQDIYGEDTTFKGMFYRCIKNHDHYVGTYPYSFKRSLGRVADKKLRRCKMNGHKAFDPLWKDESPIFKSRQEAYKWLAEKMDIEIEYTHFGMFDLDQCRKAIDFCNKLRLGEDSIQDKQETDEESKAVKWFEKLFEKKQPDPLKKYRRTIRRCGYKKNGNDSYYKDTRMGQNIIWLSSSDVMIKVYGNGYGESEYLKAPFDTTTLKKFIKRNEY